MNAPDGKLVDRLRTIFDEGHGIELPDLLTDKQFAGRDPRPAAVLIPVTDRPEPGAILTQRPLDMRSHPGQVAFPGGKLDAGEDAVEAVAKTKGLTAETAEAIKAQILGVSS